MNIEQYRITKLREYLFNTLSSISGTVNQINADMLSNNIDDYSLDKLPTASIVEKWIMGIEIHKDVYTFRSRKAYSQDVIINLKNIGFFEQFERLIKSNNDEGILPEIENIQSIECLNCGTLNHTDDNGAIFDIQIQITYRTSKYENNTISL